MALGSTSARQPAASANPFMAYNFCIEMGGILVGGFTSVDGLQVKNEVKTIRQGGVNDIEYKLPGQVVGSDLVLKGGVSAVDPLWNWFTAAAAGKVTRKNGTIYLLDNLGNTTVAWNFVNAWPIEWQGPQIDASQTLIATQSFTLAHEGIRKRGSGT